MCSRLQKALLTAAYARRVKDHERAQRLPPNPLAVTLPLTYLDRQTQHDAGPPQHRQETT